MKAVICKGPHQVAVENVPDTRIENPQDAIVKVSSAAICATSSSLAAPSQA